MVDDSFYTTRAWRRTRLAILTRDEYRCQIRDPECTGTATQVDHIVAVADGGALLEPTNLRAACAGCNVRRAQQRKRKIHNQGHAEVANASREW